MHDKRNKYYITHSPYLATFRRTLRRVQDKYDINLNLLTLINDIHLYVINNDNKFTKAKLQRIYNTSGKKIGQYFWVLVNLGFLEVHSVSGIRTYYKTTKKVNELIKFYSNVHTIELKSFSIRYNS